MVNLDNPCNVSYGVHFICGLYVFYVNTQGTLFHHVYHWFSFMEKHKFGKTLKKMNII